MVFWDERLEMMVAVKKISLPQMNGTERILFQISMAICQLRLFYFWMELCNIIASEVIHLRALQLRFF
jgi:hypothetical protein